jgi:hypothetical protein
VAVPCPAVDEDQAVTLVARWGEQLDVHHITEAGDEGELSAEQVAGYVNNWMPWPRPVVASWGSFSMAAQFPASSRHRNNLGSSMPLG